MTHSGNIADPYTLAEALSSPNIKPGHTLYLRGGTYAGKFTSVLEGLPLYPITVKPYTATGQPAEKPIIDGALTLNGQYQLWQDIEIKYTGWTTRTSQQSGSTPTDIDTSENFIIGGVGNVCNGLVVHDLAQVLAMSDGSISNFTGCLFYNIGWKAPDRGHGHSLYLQNITGRKTVKRSISANSFGYAWHAYTSQGKIDYIDYIETTCINAGALVPYAYQILCGGNPAAVEPHWYRNMTYGCDAALGFDGGATDAILVGNYLPSGLVEGDTNTYAENSGNTLTKPANGIIQFCYVDEYKNTKGFLTIYNWDKAASVTADLTNITGLSVGDTVTLKCAEDYFNCSQSLVLDADKCVAVDMRAVSHTVATAIGHDYTPPTTAPEFGCFIVEKV